jgi:hypothetical protein
MSVRQVWAALVHADGRTDMTWVIDGFLWICGRAKIWCFLFRGIVWHVIPPPCLCSRFCDDVGHIYTVGETVFFLRSLLLGCYLGQLLIWERNAANGHQHTLRQTRLAKPEIVPNIFLFVQHNKANVLQSFRLQHVSRRMLMQYFFEFKGHVK